MDGIQAMAGRRGFVLEDECPIADGMRHLFEEAEAKALGPGPTVEAALDLLDRTSALDGAVLDISFRDEMGYPVADALMERGVPFATGYDAAAIPTKHDAVTR